jgi:hypothetical protein
MIKLELRTISSYIEKISKKKGSNYILFKIEEVYIAMGENIHLHLWKICRNLIPSPSQLQL